MKKIHVFVYFKLKCYFNLLVMSKNKIGSNSVIFLGPSVLLGLCFIL